jgi:hypothetical protein
MLEEFLTHPLTSAQWSGRPEAERGCSDHAKAAALGWRSYDLRA